MLFFSVCRGSSQPRNVNVVTVYDIQNKFIGKGWWMPRRMEPSDICQIVGTLCVIYHIFCKEEEVICDFLFAAFTGTFQGVIDVVCEWGSLFVITMENKVNSSNLLC